LSQTSSRTKYPNNLIPVILPAYNTYADGTDEAFQQSANKIQTPRNHPKERIQHSEHCDSLKLIKINVTNDKTEKDQTKKLNGIQDLHTHIKQ
jgi:hypothetical protein